MHCPPVQQKGFVVGAKAIVWTPFRSPQLKQDEFVTPDNSKVKLAATSHMLEQMHGDGPDDFDADEEDDFEDADDEELPPHRMASRSVQFAA